MNTTPTLEVAKGKMGEWTIEDANWIKSLNLWTFKYPKLINIAKDLGKYKEKVKNLVLQFKDVFAFICKDMKRIPPYVCKHKIELQPKAKLAKQVRYRMNPNNATKLKEEIDKCLEV